jgi:hypothetical protein
MMGECYRQGLAPTIQTLAIQVSLTMPEISRFLGIVIGMFFNEHGPPHFHAIYGEHRITVEIESRTVRGEFPSRALRLVLEWADLHKQELLKDWERARQRQPLEPIAPLE